MALTTNWVGGWHLNNDALDASGNGNNATATGGAIYDAIVKKLGSHAGIVDGVDDYFLVPYAASLNIGAGDFTVQAWVYMTEAGTDKGVVVMDDGNSVISMYMTTANLVKFVARDAGADAATASSTTALSINTWYHVVGVRSGTTVKIYVNGVLEGSTTNAALGAVTTTDHWHIGVSVDGTDTHARWFKGRLDEVAIWSRAVTDGGVSVGQTATLEIAELYNGGAGIEIGAGQPMSLRGCHIPGIRQWQPQRIGR